MRWFRIDELEFIPPEKNYKTHFGQRIKTFLVFSQIIKMYNLRSNCLDFVFRRIMLLDFNKIILFDFVTRTIPYHPGWFIRHDQCGRSKTVKIGLGTSTDENEQTKLSIRFETDNLNDKNSLNVMSSFNVLKCPVLAIRQSHDFRTFFIDDRLFRSSELFIQKLIWIHES